MSGQIDPMFYSLASFIAAIDQSSSDVAEYLARRFVPLTAEAFDHLEGEKHDAYTRVDDESGEDSPEVLYARGYEAGVSASIKMLRAALDKIAKDPRTLAAMREQEKQEEEVGF